MIKELFDPSFSLPVARDEIVSHSVNEYNKGFPT